MLIKIVFELYNNFFFLVLQSDDCHHLSPIGPLNDLLLGQTFTIETDDQPFFVSGEQVNNFDFNLSISFKMVYC